MGVKDKNLVVADMR